MSELTGIDALAAGFRAEFGPPVEERIAFTCDPQDMSARQVFQSVQILRGEVEELRAQLATTQQDAAKWGRIQFDLGRRADHGDLDAQDLLATAAGEQA
ncbi:hypothetical protein AB0J28_09510 [Streptosporangium canum]|uniref:hypothetical protein n=1 Tax=Streptosporangium canum TaxID=324952 RepID=UPI00343F351E